MGEQTGRQLEDKFLRQLFSPILAASEGEATRPSPSEQPSAVVGYVASDSATERPLKGREGAVPAHYATVRLVWPWTGNPENLLGRHLWVDGHDVGVVEHVRSEWT